MIEEVKQLREGHEDDFTLLKYLVKVHIGYNIPNQYNHSDYE